MSSANFLPPESVSALVNRGYDHRGRQASFTLTVGGETVGTTTYAYDLLDRVTAVTADGVETTYTYDANGNRTSQTTGAVTTTYTYNKANLVTGMVNILLNDDGEDVVISEFAYTYYADGNQRTKTETMLGGDPVTTTYVYDGLGRLTGETTGEDSITYTYDASGNRVGMNRNGTVTTYAYDANNRLLSETVGDTVTTYTYDANGNTLTAGGKTYTYNDRGQQTGYSNGTTAAAYAYNPSGLRKAKTVGGSTKYFVYNGMNIVYEYSESVADSVAYFYGLNRTHNSEGEIYVYNAHGDVVQLVKDNSVVASYTYDAFGNLTSQIGESDNPFLYCGEYYDAETQTYYLRARYYNPANGRFNAEDTHWNLSNMLYGDSPVKLNEHKDALGLNRYTLLPNTLAVQQSSNLYVYCVANPIQYADLNGEFIISTTFLVVAGVAALGAAIGGYIGAKVADKQGKTGWDKVGYVATGAIIGGTIGAAAGYVAAPAVASATGVAGISVTTSGISVLSTSAGASGAGYASYYELKKAIGSAGSGYEWHHIVEQCQQTKSGFDAYLIQNTDNIIKVSREVHRQISAYYKTTTFDFTNGLSVRDWLAGQSFQFQRDFGIEVLKQFGVL